MLWTYTLDNINKLLLGVVLLSFIFLTACQLKPTKVYEKHELAFTKLVESTSEPIIIDENTKIIDVRSSFSFNTSRLENSVHLNWRDFTSSNSGALKANLERDIRRLAIKGLHPDDKVVVVGNGSRGNGEEGRVAWTLFYLGFVDVQFADINYFRGLKRISGKSSGIKNADYWNANYNKNIKASASGVKLKLTSIESNNLFLIDVRETKEYFDTQKKYPNLNSRNIEWRHFFTKNGRPNRKFKKDLKQLGIKSKDQIFVISNSGLRSGAVAASLYSLGYSNVVNIEDGYEGFKFR